MEYKLSVLVEEPGSWEVFTVSFREGDRRLKIKQQTQGEPEGDQIKLAFCGFAQSKGVYGEIDLPDEPNGSLVESALWDVGFTYLIDYPAAPGWMQYITFWVKGNQLIYRIRIMPIPAFLCPRNLPE